MKKFWNYLRRFYMMIFLLLIIFAYDIFASKDGIEVNIVPAFDRVYKTRIEVEPVFFLPKKIKTDERQLEDSSKLLMKHLEMARENYKSLLKTDTFLLSPVKPVNNIYHAENDLFYYSSKGKDSASLILKEILEWKKDNRNTSNKVYLVIFVRPFEKISPNHPFLGGGRTFNGAPNTGGGYVEMEYSSLLNDQPYPFQSTLVHELGHAFGLTHCDCLGYSMSRNDSIMSYNISHHSKGLKQSKSPGALNPEEFYVLSLNKLVFKNFSYIYNLNKAKLDKIQNCFLGQMDKTIGSLENADAIGYELFFNEKKVNGPEASYYSFLQAQNNCLWNKENQPASIKVVCRYNGKFFK